MSWFRIEFYLNKGLDFVDDVIEFWRDEALFLCWELGFVFVGNGGEG
jgi:hypothetical protein